jgi:hypothetical protein
VNTVFSASIFSEYNEASELAQFTETDDYLMSAQNTGIDTYLSSSVLRRIVSISFGAIATD